MSIMGETEVPVNGSVAQAVQFPAVAQCLDSKAMLVLLCHGTEAVRKGHEMLTKWFSLTRLETRTKESNIYASIWVQNPDA